VLSRYKEAARPSRLWRLGTFVRRPLTRSKRHGQQLISGDGVRCERAGGAPVSPVASVCRVVRRRQPPRPPRPSHGETHSPAYWCAKGAAAVRPRQPACGGSSTAFRPKRASSLGCHGRTAAARGRMTAGKWISAGQRRS